jgi:hypothetical protein
MHTITHGDQNVEDLVLRRLANTKCARNRTGRWAIIFRILRTQTHYAVDS